MATNVKTYEVLTLVSNPADELDQIFSEDPNQNPSVAFHSLSERLQAAAEYYLLLSQKMSEISTHVDVFCDGPIIELEGNSFVLDELATSGHLVELEEDDDELEDGILFSDNVDYPDDYEEDYPFDFEHSGAE